MTQVGFFISFYSSLLAPRCVPGRLARVRPGGAPPSWPLAAVSWQIKSRPFVSRDGATARLTHTHPFAKTFWESAQAGLLAWFNAPRPSRLSPVVNAGRSPSQWRVRAGFSPASLSRLNATCAACYSVFAVDCRPRPAISQTVAGDLGRGSRLHGRARFEGPPPDEVSQD
jgi:hypothetical protein